ncbi:MAG TPA: NRDE family protein [Burkholderiales bacterium]|nr:NRDE family protein [Burkholderiales bacterium]
MLAWRKHADFPLVVAANRDEFHGRAASAAGFWQDKPEILAGRDLEAKGSWMGVSRNGRFAAVTNYRGGQEPRAIESRGALVTRFLSQPTPPAQYMKDLNGSRYSGFNLLVADGEDLWWVSNRDGTPRQLQPGIYGLGNLLLESPDVAPHKERFAQALDPAPAMESMFSVLAPARIVNPNYGTRCSTVLLKSADGRVRYAERAFDPSGADGETVQHEFIIKR